MNRFILLALLLWCTAGFAEEKKYSYLFTNDFTYQKNRLADKSSQFYNSSSAFLKYGAWSGGLTFRTHNFYKQSARVTLEDPEVDLFRKYVQYATDKFEFQGGDFNAILGRGLVLSVLPNEKALRDRTVLGGDFRFHTEKWQIRTLGGTVEDEEELQKWAVAGAEVEREYWKGNRIGLHAGYIQDTETFERRGDRVAWSVSFQSDKLPGGLSYYTEIGRLNAENSFWPDGSAYYSNVGWTRQKVTLLFEFRKYRYFDSGFNNPPSADRGDEALDLMDSQTVRLYSQYSFFSPDIVTFVSIGKAWESGFAGLQMYAGMNASDIGEKLDLGFGYSFKDTFYPVKIIDGHATFRFTPTISGGLSARDKRFRQGNYGFNETDWMPQISWAPFGSFFFQRQHSRALIDGRHDFNSYGLRLNFKRDSYFEFSSGRIRGGEVCAAGQCFYLAPFRGWKLGLFLTHR